MNEETREVYIPFVYKKLTKKMSPVYSTRLNS